MANTPALHPNPIALEVIPAELIAGNRNELKQRILAHLEGGYDVIIDFAGAGYLDSSALGTLVAVNKTAGACRPPRRLVLVNLNEDLRVLFELTKVDVLLTIVTGLDDARDCLAAPSPSGEHQPRRPLLTVTGGPKA